MGGDGNLVAGWERSAGLRAPPAPTDGVLAPNGTGYLLAVGPPAQRIHPRASSVARWTSALALPVVAAMPFLLVPAPYGPVGVAALAALACWLPGALLAGLTRARIARRLAKAKVRLRGTVIEQPTVTSLLTGSAVVLATSDCAGVVEARGIDFDVRLAGGEIVRVPARDALLVGRGQRVRGQPSCGPLTVSVSGGEPRLRSALLSTDGWIGRLAGVAARELTLGPGDEVEICGALDVEPDPVTQRGFARGPALRAVIRPAGGVPVIVRKRVGSAGSQNADDDADADADEGGASPSGGGTVTSAPR